MANKIKTNCMANTNHYGQYYCRYLLSFLPFILFVFIFISFNVQAELRQNTVENYLSREAKSGKVANALIKQSSPYLLQHAYNPVRWNAWGGAAFSKAKKQNKPIFLSIGYSTCHWCHVMAHESFENKKIADYLNKYFIAIKVDREERPDIDNVYMAATRLIHGSGGWPMTVFLDAQLRPFHAATYYPPFTVGNNLGLLDVLKIIHQLWLEEPEEVAETARLVSERIKKLAEETSEHESIRKDVQQQIMKQISLSFDNEMGGFGDAPKFPKPGIFSYLIERSKMQGRDAEQAKKMMQVTLDAMAEGGIYDRLAGGFHRYSVDAQWQVPHFEKMLYSQALLSLSYADFFTIYPNPIYKKVTIDTLDFVVNEMSHPEGGFYSALDADSEKQNAPGEHAEGAYYLWSESELKKLLSKEEFVFASEYFDIGENGNIYSDPRNEFGDGNILAIAEKFRGVALNFKQDKLFQSIKKILSGQRLSRPRPHLDDKIITAWNGMMIKALSNAAMVFPDKKEFFVQQAIKTSEFILTNLRDKKTGKLYRQYRAGKASADASLNDYAWLIQGLLALYDVSENQRWLDVARQLSAIQHTLFFDVNSNAYFETSDTDLNILFRSKSIFDGALPSANAIVFSNLKRLSQRVDDANEAKQYLLQSERLLQSFASAINENPAAAAMALAQ